MKTSQTYIHDAGKSAQKDLRILFLEPQPCIRALKYAIALRHYLKSKVAVFFGHLGYSLTELYGFGEEYFDQTTRLDSVRICDSLRRIIGKWRPQIIHSHNAPDMLTVAAIDVAEGIPVVHDIHEILSIHNSGFFEDDDADRLKRYREEERIACEQSDGRIYATEGIERYIQQQYNTASQDDIVFYNYASESLMPCSFSGKISTGETHVVYIGCITSVVEGSHYDLREIFRRIADHRIHIHFYPTSNHITKSNASYRRMAESNPFIHCHEHLDHRRLLYEITQYDFGWAGLNGARNKKHLDIALQNKVFDYIGSGLPVLAFHHKTIQDFIQKHGVGLIVNDIDELPELLRNADCDRLRDRVVRTRHRLTFESNIPRLVDFYSRIVGICVD